MVRRCNNINDKDYKNYGALGITVCSNWLDYKTFATDMGEPSGEETLSRIDPYGDYELSNCKWDNLTVQARNIRLPKLNTSGHIGVSEVYLNSWMAKITVKKNHITLKYLKQRKKLWKLENN
jgi:hypothetical protein